MPRSRANPELDVEVAVRLFGYRWVEWNREMVGEGALYPDGRFLAPEDDGLFHLFIDASEAVPEHLHPLGKVPEYSTDERQAFAAAERSGLFLRGGAVLSREPDGAWMVELEGRRHSGPRLAEVVAEASLRWFEQSGSESNGR